MKKVYAYMRLCKIKISLLSSFSAAAGFTLSNLHATARITPLIAGVFFLACGACALNQYQERYIDARMPRTANRPLPSGMIAPLNALIFSVILIASGFFLLLFKSGFLCAGLGVFAVVWYNGAYTYLKRISAFAVIPGALTGAIPPAIGWIAGGGSFFDSGLPIICFFFFMWQVPHFWLLAVNYGEEYRKAGLPSLTSVFSKKQLERIIFIWIISTSVSCLLLSIRGLIHSSPVIFSLFGASLALAFCGSSLVRKGKPRYSLIFNMINIYMLVVLVLLSVDSFLI